MTLEAVLFECLRHFVHRDHSNAATHCAPVHYRPITFRVAEALAELHPGTTTQHVVNQVLAHAGQYEEDPDR